MSPPAVVITPSDPAAPSLTITRSGTSAIDLAAEGLLRAGYARWVSVLGFAPDLTVDLRVSDLPGHALGHATLLAPGEGALVFDIDAAGSGWFLDPTPYEDSTFSGYDFLTVAMHELGHLFGVLNLDAPDLPLTPDGNHVAFRGDLLSAHIPPSVRLLPSALDVELVRRGQAALNTGDSNAFVPIEETLEATLDDITVGLGNGGFSDPSSGAWRTVGSVDLTGGNAILSANPVGLISDLLQTFIVPAGATAIRFDVTGLDLATADRQAPSVFEAALLASDFSRVLTGQTPFTNGDAALSIGTDGTYTIDLTGIAPGTEIGLFFDLVAFAGSDAATATIDNVQLVFPDGQAPRLVAGPIIENGAAQRSMVRTIEFIIFGDIEASLDPTDFRLTLAGSETLIPAAVAFDSSASLITLTFPDQVGASLADGNYVLTLVPSGITAPGGQPLADVRSQPFDTAPTFTFFRLFGDVDGDRDVDFLDTFHYQNADSTIASDANYNDLFDSDADGDIDALDLFRFRQNYFTTLPAPDDILGDFDDDGTLSNNDRALFDAAFTAPGYDRRADFDGDADLDALDLFNFTRTYNAAIPAPAPLFAQTPDTDEDGDIDALDLFRSTRPEFVEVWQSGSAAGLEEEEHVL